MYALLKAGQDLWGNLSTSSKVIAGGSAALAVANIVLLVTEPSEAATQVATVAATSGAMVLSGASAATATIFGGLAALAATAQAQQQPELTSRNHKCIATSGTLSVLEDKTKDPALDGATICSQDLTQKVGTSNLNLCEELSEDTELQGHRLAGANGPFGTLHLIGSVPEALTADGTAVACTPDGELSFVAVKNLRSDAPRTTMQALAKVGRESICPYMEILQDQQEHSVVVHTQPDNVTAIIA